MIKKNSLPVIALAIFKGALQQSESRLGGEICVDAPLTLKITFALLKEMKDFFKLQFRKKKLVKIYTFKAKIKLHHDNLIDATVKYDPIKKS